MRRLSDELNASCTNFMLRIDLSYGYYEFHGAGIVVQRSDKRESSASSEWLLKKSINVVLKDCRMPLTNFHLLLFGVTITIIKKVGNVVAFSFSLVFAVRAKLDSRYLQRQYSTSIFNLNHIDLIQKYQIYNGVIYHRWMGVTPIPVSMCNITKLCNTYYRRY